jgi:hypothetical protein
VSKPGANPTIASYNASGVKIFTTHQIAYALVELFCPDSKNALAYYSAGVVVVTLKVVGLAPGITSYDRNS